MQRVHTQPFVVVAALLEKAGNFLLVQENWGSVKGLWNTPAGWLELGENPLQAVTREVKEESGYDFTPTALVGIYSSVKEEGQEKKQPIKLVYRGDITGTQDEVDEAEIADRKWFSPNEIYKMNKGQLRDLNIKQIVKDYLAGQEVPLQSIKHTEVD
jgi:phosphatase NudJ